MAEEKKDFKGNSKDGKSKTLTEMIAEKPVLSIFFIFFTLYMFWYIKEGPKKTEIRYDARG